MLSSASRPVRSDAAIFMSGSDSTQRVIMLRATTASSTTITPDLPLGGWRGRRGCKGGTHDTSTVRTQTTETSGLRTAPLRGWR